MASIIKFKGAFRETVVADIVLFGFVAPTTFNIKVGDYGGSKH